MPSVLSSVVFQKVKTALMGLGILFYFLLAIDLYRTFQGTFFFVFQARDIFRAEQILKGKHIFFGPEMTGGGNLLGPFYYYLISPALALWHSWMSVWGLMMLLSAAGAGAGWYWLRKRLSPASAWFWLGIFSTAFFTRVLLELFLNVSFLLAFAVTAMIFICESEAAETRKLRDRALNIACFVLGLGIQLHFSVIVWLLAILSIRTFLRDDKGQKVDGRALITGLSFFILPLLPYIFWRLMSGFGLDFGQQNVFAGKNREALPTLIAFARNLAVFPYRETFGHIIRLAEVLPAPIFLLIPIVGFMAKRPKEGASTSNEDWARRTARTLVICGFFGLIPFAYFFVAPIGRRYVIPLGIPMYFLAAFYFERCRLHLKSVSIFLVLIGVFLFSTLIFIFRFPSSINATLLLAIFAPVILPALLLLYTGRPITRAKLFVAIALTLSISLSQAQRALIERGYTSSGHVGVPRFVPNTKEWLGIWRTVYGKTCWSYEEAIGRIYFVDHHLEQDPRPGYEMIQNEVCGRESAERPDGFIVSILKRDKKTIQDWLLSSHIQEDLKTALRSGHLKLLPHTLANGAYIVPYLVTDAARIPRRFHNTGEAYFRSADDERMQGGGEVGEALKLSTGHHLFRWNECPSQHSYCGTGAEVLSKRRDGNLWEFQVKVMGSTLSQSSPWISPEWTASWRLPYLEVTCDGKKSTFSLGTSIGYEQAYGHRLDYPFDYNNSFVAPLEREFQLACRKEPTLIAIGRASSKIENVTTKGSFLPGRRLEINF